MYEDICAVNQVIKQENLAEIAEIEWYCILQCICSDCLLLVFVHSEMKVFELNRGLMPFVTILFHDVLHIMNPSKFLAYRKKVCIAI